MEKRFFEAFPNLELGGVQKDLFEQTMVERITATKRKDFLRVFFRSERLIQKELVYAVEREIKKQFFPRKELQVKLYERFVLSGQYNPQKLMELYRDSILMEIKECDHILYTIFRQADIQFPEEAVMEIVLEDSVIAKSKEDELIGILDKVLNERCGFQVKFQTAYKEAQASKYKEEDALRIRRIVEVISSRFDGNAETFSGEPKAASAKEKEAAGTAPAAEKPKTAAVAKQKSPAASGAERKSYGSFEKGADRSMQRRALKRSDNPNIIFGRDFEEESINIEEIWGEMGEVVIRGKVRALETREIRNERTIVSFEITDFTDTIKVKMFIHNDQLAELTADLKTGAFLKIKGVTVNDTFDRELTIGSVVGVMKIPDFTTARMDNSARKRVELHCHTKMSDMDGVSDVKDYQACKKVGAQGTCHHRPRLCAGFSRCKPCPRPWR